MKIAIHQPHYFPWLGYFDKMAKVDKFILLDKVQLTDKSNMFRNVLLSKSGVEKYITLPFEKKGYMEKQFQELKLNENVIWQENHKNFIMDNYKKAPFFKEIWEKIDWMFEKKYIVIIDVVLDSLATIRELLNVNTTLIKQSELTYDPNSTKNYLVLDLCNSVSADLYLSGNGARKYMENSIFEENGIEVYYQHFKHPTYTQINCNSFIHNLSTLDILFNCGIERTREIFWKNVESINEFIMEDYS